MEIKLNQKEICRAVGDYAYNNLRLRGGHYRVGVDLNIQKEPPDITAIVSLERIGDFPADDAPKVAAKQPLEDKRWQWAKKVFLKFSKKQPSPPCAGDESVR